MACGRDTLFAGAMFAAASLLGSGPVRAAEPVCQRWKLDTVCTTSPAKIRLGEEFTATVTAKNAGDVALVDVTIQLRADAGGALCIAGPGADVKTLVPRMEPGESKQVTARFLPESVGTARVLGSARDALGWAAANCACAVEVEGYPGLTAAMATKDAKGEGRAAFKPGETIVFTVSVRNAPETAFPPDLQVDLALPKEMEFVSGDAGGTVPVTGRGRRAQTTAFRLTPDRPSLEATFTVKAIAASQGLRLRALATVSTATGVPLASLAERVSVED